MEWLNDDLRSFIDRSWREHNPDVCQMVIRLILSLANDARLASEFTAHKQFLDLLRLAYMRAVALNRVDDGARPLARSIVSALRSYIEYRLVHGRQPKASLDLAYAQAVQALFGMLKSAIDQDDASVDGCVIELTDLFDAVDFKQRGGSELTRGSSECDLLSAYVVGVCGYLIARPVFDQSAETSSERLIGVLRNLLVRVAPWRALRTSLDRDDSGLSWTEWETSLWPDGKRGGTLGHIDDGIRTTVALAYLLRGHGATNTDVLEDLRADDRKHLVEQVRDALTRAIERPWLVRAFPELANQDRVAAELTELNELAQRYGIEEESERAALPVDRERLTVFASKVESIWNEPSLIRGDLAASHSAAAHEGSLFGFASFAPKDFFSSSDVYADPEQLAQSVGGALVRGESVAILRTLGELPLMDSEIDDLRDLVGTKVTALRENGLNPAIVVVNSWQAARVLTDSLASPDADAAGVFDGTTVTIEYSDDDATRVIVADLDAALRIDRWPVEAQHPFDLRLAGGMLLVGVEEMTSERAQTLIAEDQEFRRDSDGTLSSLDAAERRLLAQVHVRALVRFSVVLEDPAAGIVISIPNADW